MNNTAGIPEGVGPHEGIELKLMLAGKKPMAMFSDVVPPSFDMKIEDFFAYVDTGRIVHVEETYLSKSACNDPFHYVYFALENEAWRIDEMRSINHNIIDNDACLTDELERRIGDLLGYAPEQITEYISWKHYLKTQDNLLKQK